MENYEVSGSFSRGKITLGDFLSSVQILMDKVTDKAVPLLVGDRKYVIYLVKMHAS